MLLRRTAFVFLFTLASCCSLPAQTKTVAERLGYPADAKLLIIHADDLAIAHSEDAASFAALDKGYVTSASIIVPGPWLTEVADYAKAHPDADLGIHLALTSEWKTFRWGPVESKDKVPTLLDPAGALWPLTEKVAKNVKPQEAEMEYRAQIKQAIAAGIHPTHLDTHMGSALSTPEILAVYVKIAHEFHLPFLAPRIPGDPLKLSALLNENDVLLDSVTIATPGVPADKWKEFYVDAIKNMKPGLNEIIVHLGHDDAELQAVMVDHPDYGAAWRQRDFDVFSGPELKKALQDNRIVLIHWKDLQKLASEPH
ncbi:MAG: polysaccharide deacetylase family protein [Acidobacteria bacterium]|nr:polysaccharide deacetylase family protein [Acidobacteriota bacterium]MBS1865920.1 polysaccharide deacetylase family protein [Acidobacteriota bacterium]